MNLVPVVVDFSLRANGNRRFRLPGARSGTRSMLYRFRTDDGSELVLGGEATEAISGDFVPGRSYVGVRLVLWVDRSEDTPQVGAPFVVWYGSDIGDGQVRSIISP